MKLQEERKSADSWLKVIADYLLTRDDIKDSLDKENKSLEECGNYILQEAKKRGNQVAMTDDEVFSLAVHYYDEDDITAKQTSKADVKVAAAKGDKPLKPLSEYRKEIDQTESNFIDKKTGKPVDIDKIVEKRVKKKLAEIKKTEQEKKEKLYKNELSEKESRKQREIKLAEINAEKEFNDGNEKETYSYAEYMRLRNQCRLLLEKNKQLKKQYTDLREKVLDRGYMK